VKGNNERKDKKSQVGAAEEVKVFSQLRREIGEQEYDS
jgi:hypothetical protein